MAQLRDLLVTGAARFVNGAYFGGASTFGSVTQPIWWNNGFPQATTYSLSATLNAGSANRLAYYSGTNVVSPSAHYASATQLGINITNASTIGSRSLYVNGTSYYYDTMEARTGAPHLGLKLGSTYLNAIDGNIIFQNNSAIRFGGDSWDYNVWAGLKYVHSNKKIVLGLADGTEFTANAAQSGGTFKIVGMSTVDMNSTASITNLAIGGGIYWNPYVESATDSSDAASITVLKSGAAGGTELRISQLNDDSDIINLVASRWIYLNGKRAFTINDAWLRINEDNLFTEGIYTGQSIVRTDAQFQVGDHGSKFYANSSGNGYFSNTLGIAGTNTSYNLYVNGNSWITGYLNNILLRSVNINNSTNFASSATQEIFGTTDNNNSKFTVLRMQSAAPAALRSDYASGIAWKSSDTYGMLSVAYHTPGIKIAGGNGTNPVWWVGIDASSGVTYNFNKMPDSDKLDGLHENSFFRYRDTTSTNGAGTLWTQIGSRSYHNALPDGLSGVYNYGQVLTFPGNGARFEIYCAHSSSTDGNLWYRSGWNDDKRPWRKIIDSANIGSQSVATATKFATARTIRIGAASKTFDGTANISYTPYEMGLVRALYNTDSNLNAFANRGHALGMCDLGDNGSVDNPGGKTGWHHVINLTWVDAADNNGSTTNEWCTQIANACGSSDLYVRSRGGGSITNGTAWTAPWTKILTAANYAGTLDGRYVNITGDTMTGDLIIQHGTSGSVAYGATNPTITFKNIDGSQNCSLIYTDYDEVRAPAGIALIGNQGNEWFQAPRVFGAVWNDYAEYRSTSTVNPGQCVVETGLGDLIQSTKRLQPGANIVSDTFGFAIGETEQTKTPIAVSGRVLAYPYEDRNSYQAGDPVCSGPNGTISKMTREEVREYPDRIVGTVSEIPEYETWGTGNVKVDGRIWIKVK